MRENEKALIEAVGNMFKNSEHRLGIAKFGDEAVHRMEFRWSGINDMFALKTADSPFHESLTAGFFDIHSYKYLDDPTFKLSLDKRLSATGIPISERLKAAKCIDEIIESLGKDKFQEKEAGWHPNLDEIADLTRNADKRKPSKEPPFTGGGPAPDRNEIK